MALVATSLILVGGFLVLAQSAFDLNASMSRMAAITIVFALLADFLLLPSLLMKLDAGKPGMVFKKDGERQREVLSTKVQDTS